jgi:hypothetical protein
VGAGYIGSLCSQPGRNENTRRPAAGGRPGSAVIIIIIIINVPKTSESRQNPASKQLSGSSDSSPGDPASFGVGEAGGVGGLI